MINLKEESYCAPGVYVIKTLNLERFRCFASAKLADCRRINIIVGDNGSGKTSLLEALMLVGSYSPAIALRVRQWRGFEGMQYSGQVRDIEEAIWGDIFHDFDRSKAISIATRGDIDHTRRLTITYDLKGYTIPVPEKAGFISPQKAPVTFRWNVSQRNPVTVTPRLEGGNIVIPPTPEPATETYFFAANHTYSSQESAWRYSKLSKNMESDMFLEQFRIHFPEVESLSVEMNANYPMMYCKLKSFKQKVPLNIASSGMTKLAALLLAFPANPRCTVLIDEIENGFYYRRNPKIWRTLHDFCVKYDCQVFASSHSGEMLSAAAEVAEENPDDFSIVHVSKGILNQFYGETFANAIKENLEIR